MGALLIKRKYPERKPCNVVKINNEASRVLTRLTNETGIPKYKLAEEEEEVDG